MLLENFEIRGFGTISAYVKITQPPVAVTRKEFGFLLLEGEG